MTPKEALIAYRKIFVKEMVESEGYKKAKAFGEFERFVQSEQSATITEDRYIQRGPAYTGSLDVGFNHAAPVTAIYDWLALGKYGFTFKDDRDRLSTAWAIVTNQKKRGSFKRRNTSARTDIIEGSIEKTRPELNRLVAGAYLAQVLSPISKEIQQINKEQS